MTSTSSAEARYFSDVSTDSGAARRPLGSMAPDSFSGVDEAGPHGAGDVDHRRPAESDAPFKTGNLRVDGASAPSLPTGSVNTHQLRLHGGVVAKRSHAPGVVARWVVAVVVQPREVVAQVTDVVDGRVEEVVATDAAARVEGRQGKAVLGARGEGPTRLRVVMHARVLPAHGRHELPDARRDPGREVAAVGVLGCECVLDLGQ